MRTRRGLQLIHRIKQKKNTLHMVHGGCVMGAGVIANCRPVICWVVGVVPHPRRSLPLVPVILHSIPIHPLALAVCLSALVSLVVSPPIPLSLLFCPCHPPPGIVVVPSFVPSSHCSRDICTVCIFSQG
jgi:hypothetical protein